MGLKFSGLVLDPFLYNGFNLAILLSNFSQVEKPWRNGDITSFCYTAIGFTRIYAPSFKNLEIL